MRDNGCLVENRHTCTGESGTDASQADGASGQHAGSDCDGGVVHEVNGTCSLEALGIALLTDLQNSLVEYDYASESGFGTELSDLGNEWRIGVTQAGRGQENQFTCLNRTWRGHERWL